MLLNRYVQYCKCKGRLRAREEKEKEAASQADGNAYFILGCLHSPAAYGPDTLSLPDLRANDSAGHGTLPGRQWTSTYVCCRQCSVKFALFSNPLSPTVTPLLPLYNIPWLFVLKLALLLLLENMCFFSCVVFDPLGVARMQRKTHACNLLFRPADFHIYPPSRIFTHCHKFE